MLLPHVIDPDTANQTLSPYTHTPQHRSIIAKKLVAYFGGYENVFKVRSNKYTYIEVKE